MTLSRMTHREATAVVPECPNCHSRLWRARQYSDCWRTVQISEVFGVASNIGFWQEMGDTDENGHGGNFRQERWACQICGLEPSPGVQDEIQAAFDKENL